MAAVASGTPSLFRVDGINEQGPVAELETQTMTIKRLVIAGVAPLFMVAALAGCSSPQEKAAKAQEKSSKAELQIKEERLKLLDEYKSCIKEAGDDRAKADECDRILKAIEALK